MVFAEAKERQFSNSPSWNLFPGGHSFKNKYRFLRIESTFALVESYFFRAAAEYCWLNSSQVLWEKTSSDSSSRRRKRDR